jgi:hypothetical protein
MIQWLILKIDYLKSFTMSNFTRNNENYYWNGGAFCVNCGKLDGDVTNNGVHPIWHKGCKLGCNSTWEDQDFSPCDDYEYAHLLDEEERWNEACRDTREEEDESYLEDERRMDVMEYESRCEEWEREDMANEDQVVSPRHDTLNQRASCTGPPVFPMELLVNGYNLHDLILDGDDYDPYDEETELEARRQYDREMEAEDREEYEDYYPGTFLRDFNPHTDTNNYRLN